MKCLLSRMNVLTPLRNFCFLFFISLQLFAPKAANAKTVTFQSGSYIIPMDTTYQDDGMWLAYGLIYDLLNQDPPIPIYWAIANPKNTYETVDCTLSTGENLQTSAPLAGPISYTGGPFIIDSSDAEVALPLITAWWTAHGNQPVIHEATSSFDVNVDMTLNNAPIIAIDDSNADIAITYLKAAQIPDGNGNLNWPYTPGGGTASNPSILTQTNIEDGQLFTTSSDGCEEPLYDVFIAPSNTGFMPPYSVTDPTNSSTIAYSELDDFVFLGGGFIGTDTSVVSFENAMADLTINGAPSVKELFNTSLSGGKPGGFLTQNSPAFPGSSPQNVGTCWSEDAGQAGSPTYPNTLDLPIAQSVYGAAAPVLPMGAVLTWLSPWQPASSSPTDNAPTYWDETNRIAYFDQAAAGFNCTDLSTRYDTILHGIYHDGTGAGTVSLLGGRYDSTVPYSANPHGTYLRSFFNAVFLNTTGAAQLYLEIDPTICANNTSEISLVNIGCGLATLDSDIVITLAPQFTYDSTSFGPSPTVAGQVLTWSHSVLSIEDGAIAFTINVKNTAPSGDLQVATLEAQYHDVYNNKYTIDACTGAIVMTADAGPNQALCALATTSATLAGNIPAAGETGLWTQLAGPATTITTPTSPTTTVTGLTGTNQYEFQWTVSRPEGSCSATMTIQVTATPAQPGAISGPTSVCAGSTQTYSIAAVPNATSYTWTLPSGWTGTSTTNSIHATAAGGDGAITVTANYNPCISAPQQLTVKVNPLPTVTISPAEITIYKGRSTVLTASGASTYSWSPGSSSEQSLVVSPTVTTNYTVIGTSDSGCSQTATTTVTVIDSSIMANPDVGNVPNGAIGGIAVANVLTNDTLNGASPTLADVILTPISPFSPFLILNADASVSVPPGTPDGVYTIGYQICEQLNPSNCSATTVQGTVGPSIIVANPDFGSVPDGTLGGIAVANVLANDTLNGFAPTLTEVTLTPISPFSPFLVLNADASVTVPPGTPAGVYTIGYQICEKLNPANCSATTVQGTVGTPATVIATNRTVTVTGGPTSGPKVFHHFHSFINALAGDTVNGQPATVANVSISLQGQADPHLSLDPTTGIITILPGTLAGTYTLQYKICAIASPTVCATATITVNVMQK